MRCVCVCVCVCVFGIASHMHVSCLVLGDRFPITTITATPPIILMQDISWHKSHKDLFVSVGDDKQMIMYVDNMHVLPTI